MRKESREFKPVKARRIRAPEKKRQEETAGNISVISETGEVVAGVTEQTGEQTNPLFKKRFFLAMRPEKAVLRATACGVYRAYINGVCVSPGLFDPGWTDYETRVQVQEMPVEEYLKEGENTVELLTADGWALANLLGQGRNFFSDTISVIAELELTFSGAGTEFVATDKTWEVWNSPIVYSSWYNGEELDYSREPAFLGNAAECAPDALSEDGAETDARLVFQEKEHVTAHERIPAQKLLTGPHGETILDFGQNLAGFAEIKGTFKKGDRIRIHHAEALDADGSLYTKNLRTARQEMTYIAGKDGQQTFCPLFSFQGFRYIELEEYPGSPDLSGFTAVAVYTDMKRTGYFDSGNELLNKLYRCILWNQRSNFIDVPTDCPQRDERLGWLGDAQVFCRAAAFNYDVENFYRTWLGDVSSGQLPDGSIRAIAPYNRKAYPFRASAAWADAVTIIPYELYLQYGDTACMEEMFPCMCRWVDYVHGTGPEEYLWIGGNHYGDWLALDGPDPRHPKTDKDFLASAYFYHSADLLVKCGHILKKDVTVYEEMLPKIRSAFRDRFVKDGLPSTDTEAACAVLLSFGLLDDAEKKKTAAHLAHLVKQYKNRLVCGVVGAPLILHALAENGHAEAAFDMLLEEETPSWLGMVKNGATTLWERPDTYENGKIKDIRNASFNHYMFGSVLDFITGCAGGLKADDGSFGETGGSSGAGAGDSGTEINPGAGVGAAETGAGYRSFTWRPMTDRRIGSLRLSYESRAGKIEASWQMEEDGTQYQLAVPAGAKARVILPDGTDTVVSGATYTRFIRRKR